MQRVPEPVVQEHLPGPEITSDVLCLEDGQPDAVVSRRRLEVRSGEVAKGVTVHDPEVVRQCARIAEARCARKATKSGVLWNLCAKPAKRRIASLRSNDSRY